MINFELPHITGIVGGKRYRYRNQSFLVPQGVKSTVVPEDRPSSFMKWWLEMRRNGCYVCNPQLYLK